MKKLFFLLIMPLYLMSMEKDREIMPLKSLKSLCLEKVASLAKNDSGIRSKIKNNKKMSKDMHEELKWTLFRQDPQFIEKIKKSGKQRTMNAYIVSTAWHPVESKLALGLQDGKILMINAEDNSIESIGKESNIVFRLWWSSDGKIVNTLRLEKFVWKRYKKTNDNEWNLLPQESGYICVPNNGKVQSFDDRLRVVLDLNKKLVHIIDNAQKEANKILFTIAPCQETCSEFMNRALRIIYEHKTQSVGTVAWGPKHFLSILLHNQESIEYCNASFTGWEFNDFELDGEINIYSQNDMVWDLIGKFPIHSTGVEALSWSPNGDYLACYKGSTIEFIPTKFLNMPLEELFTLYDQYKKERTEKELNKNDKMEVDS